MGTTIGMLSKRQMGMHKIVHLRLASQKEGMFGRCPNFGKWLCTARTPMPPGCDVYCVGDSGYSHYSTLTGSDATFVSAQSRTNPAKHLATTMV